MSEFTHTRGFWQQGRLLMTKITKRWSEEEKEETDKQEKLRVFVRFSGADEGRSRELIAVCQKQEDAERIALCVNLLRLLSNDEIRNMGIIEPTKNKAK